MTYHPQDTYCSDQTQTPRVRTIFRQRQAPAPPPPPAPSATTGEQTERPALGWHHLICEILESLFPFPEAYTVVRQTLDAFGQKLPAPA